MIRHVFRLHNPAQRAAKTLIHLFIMTLRAFFDYLGENPLLLLAYFALIPLTAFLAGMLGRGEGHLSPWKYLYSVLIYGVCVPGIFAVALSVYFFLFERGSIMNANVLIQVLPVVSMVLTLAIIRQNVSFDAVPGFEKISSLMLMIGAVFVLMYLLDRTHLIAFVNVPVQYLILIVAGLLLAFRYGFRQLIAR
ncbi:MAG TPA: hypothetical protein PLW66_03330 [Saprospiraceae bacterium]|nr:hypothetical protein [Saprospiraceae bacterium]